MVNTHKKLVIIADDEGSLYSLQEALPRIFDCEVEHVTGGEAVAAALKAHSANKRKVSLILTDNRMLAKCDTFGDHRELISGTELVSNLRSGTYDKLVHTMGGLTHAHYLW